MSDHALKLDTAALNAMLRVFPEISAERERSTNELVRPKAPLIRRTPG